MSAHLGWVVVAMFVAMPAAGQERARPDGSGERRIALVMGNDKYGAAPLVNAANDARAVATALGQIGFVVDTVVDASAESMARAVEQFTARVQAGDVALFYYSGHGVQVDGINYLLPVDFRGGDEVSLKFRAMSVNEIDERLGRRGARVRLLVLDACRDNPFRGTRSGAAGLASYTAEGALIAFATAAGRTASDNAGAANGLFTQYFLEGLRKPGMSATDLFKWVRLQVRDASAGRQVPWLHDGLIGDFVFRAGEAAPVPAPAAPAVDPATYARLPSAGLRWAYATLPAGDPAALAGTHAEPVRQHVAADFLFSASHASSVMWYRNGLDVTVVMNDRVAGAALRPAPALTPVRKVVYVNLSSIGNASRIGREYHAQVEALRTKLTGEINERQQRLAALQAKRADGSARLETDTKALDQQIEAARRGVQLATQNAEASLTELQQRLQKQFGDALTPVMKNYTDRAGIDVVLQSEWGVAFAASSLDISSALARMLDGDSGAVASVSDLRQAAYLNVNWVTAESRLGKSLAAEYARLQAERKQELNDPARAPAATQALQALHNTLTQRLADALRPILQRMCPARGIDLVLLSTDSGLMAANTGLDISSDVVKALDAAYPK